jgi:translocation and assembly module TamA
LVLCAWLAAGCANKPLITGPWIHKITFTGVQKVPLKTLRPKLAVQESSFFPLAPKHFLDNPFTVELDRDRIEAFYHARGYYDAKVTRADTKPYKGDQAVDIAFTVKEGEPTRLQSLNIKGLDGLGADEQNLRAKLPLFTAEIPGLIFDHDQYEREKTTLLYRLRQRGYAFAQVTGEVTVNRDSRLAEAAIVAVPGPLVRLGEAQVEGTQLLSAALIQKHAAVPTGELYKPETVDAIQDKLYSLGVFSTVHVEARARPGEPQVADVAIAVTEGKFRELRLGGGIGIEPERNEIHLEVAYTKRRFLGGLRTLQLTLQPGYAVMPALWSSDTAGRRSSPIASFKADFTQPDLLGKNSALTASLVYDLGLEYAYQYHGPGLRLGVQKGLWQNKIKLAASYNFQFLDFFNPVLTADMNAAVGSLFGYTDPYRLGYLQEQAVLDLRNRALDATRGFFLGVLGEQGGVYTGSAFTYEKLQPELRGYVSVGASDRLTFAARLVFGQLWVQGDTGSPVTQRFYLGGPGSHRGFGYNRLSYQVCTAHRAGAPIAEVTQLGCGEAEQYLQHAKDFPGDPAVISDFRRLPVGGDQMVLGQLEVRLKLFKLWGNWFSLAAFSDVGDVANPAKLLDFTKLHVAVGGGLRYRTVIGTVRFDLGVRLNRLDPSEADGTENPDPGERFAYHISIGESF